MNNDTPAFTILAFLFTHSVCVVDMSKTVALGFPLPDF